MSPEEADDERPSEPDGVEGGPPPHPLDRPWVHPAELSSFVATPEQPPREVKPREWAIGIGSALAASVVTVLVLVAFGALGGRERAPAPPPVVTSPNDILDSTVAAQVAATAAPSIVMVRGGTDTPRPVGSGVAVASDKVMTTAHVLAGMTKIDIVTSGAQALPAHVIGTDPQTDLALLSVPHAALTVARMSQSTPDVGSTVIAVATTERGTWVGINVISDSNLMVDTGTGIPVAGLIETGIAIRPSMTGGVLLDRGGAVVGILTAPPAPAGDRGALAVPVRVVRDVDDQLDADGKVTHGWLGVLFGPDPTDRPHGGALLAVVPEKSPAYAAGLRAGDIITAADNNPITGRTDLIAVTRAKRPKDPVNLVYVRDGRQARNTQVTLGTDPQVTAPLFGNPG